jgi:glutamate synthase (NADPH) large chain
VLDRSGQFANRVNPEAVIWQRVQSPFWRTELETLIERHHAATGSPLAKRLLEDFDDALADFWQVVPKEMLSRLEQPLSAAA